MKTGFVVTKKRERKKNVTLIKHLQYFYQMKR